MTEREKTDFPPNVRKCPRHNAWIQVRKAGPDGPGRYKIRYCPRCDLERLQKEAQQKKEAGTEGFIPRIGTL